MKDLTDVSRYYNGNIEELRGRKDPEAVKIVAKEMERLFAYEMIKAMRETTDVSSKKDLGGSAYTSMFDMELAKLFSERGLGLQDILLQGLNRIAAKSGNVDKNTAAGDQKSSVAGQKTAVDSQKPIFPTVSRNVPLLPALSSPAAGGEMDTKKSSKD
jgi:Rod binding domain-containing protein